MQVHRIGLIATATISALVVSVLVLPEARSQVQAIPSLVPIGVSSSGNTSTAWFHEPSSRQAIACQTVQQGAGISGIQCVAGKLPQ